MFYIGHPFTVLDGAMSTSVVAILTWFMVVVDDYL